MIKEKTFLRVFKKNCKEMLKNTLKVEQAVDNLSHRECPLPEGCQEGKKKLGYNCGCVGSSPTIPTRDCPISKEWQNNVFYFQKNKEGIEGKELCNKMIKIIKEEMTI